VLNWEEMGSHELRLLTGVGLAFPLFALIGWGPLWSWASLICVVAAVALWEFENLMFPDGLRGWMRGMYYSLGVAMPACGYAGATTGIHGSLAVGLFLGLTGILVRSPGDAPALSRLSTILFGWLYIPYLLSYVLLIGQLPHARAWVFYLLFVTIAADAGAYYCGRFLGAHRLYERVSPKKTVEGSLGGLACSILVGSVYGMIFLEGQSLVGLALSSGVLCVVSQFGDLFESMIKRMVGKKDSSDILPGHGGIMDRLDSLLFGFPVVWFLALS
jgi:phosphatidate cytidylyltransferase